MNRDTIRNLIHQFTGDCRYCIDGMQPSGTFHPALGEIYRYCEFCILAGTRPVCPGCYSLGVFPARYSCTHCLAEHLDELDLAAVLCRKCHGVIELIPRDTIGQAIGHD